MNTFESVNRFLQRQLAEESAMDGRIVVMAVVVAYIACLGLVNFLAPNLDIFRKVGVPPIVPIFADLRAILAGFESTRMGYDVIYSMPSEVYGRESLAYPSECLQKSRPNVVVGC